MPVSHASIIFFEDNYQGELQSEKGRSWNCIHLC